MKNAIRTHKIRFCDESSGKAIVDLTRPQDLNELNTGQHVSPVTTKSGRRVNWEVVFVEEIDMEYTFVYIRNHGFLPS